MSATLGVLIPVEITDAMFTSSTAPETDYAAWSSVTTYAAGTKVISTTTHRVYESLVGSNTNHDPTDINNRVGASPWWLDFGPTNKWACLDTEVSTPTTLASPLTMVFKPGFFNSICMFGLAADHLAITVKDATGGNTVYSYSADLENSAPGDYYEYFFSPFSPQTDFVADGIDQYNAAEVTITLTATSTTVSVGMLQMGDLRPLGQTVYGAKAKPKTFSYIAIDDFGNNQIVRRKKSRDMDVVAYLDIEEADSIMETVNSLLDVPCMWIGTNETGYSGLRCFGLGSGEISFDHPTAAVLNLNVKGLI